MEMATTPHHGFVRGSGVRYTDEISEKGCKSSPRGIRQYSYAVQWRLCSPGR
jgi:hypothetical protein